MSSGRRMEANVLRGGEVGTGGALVRVLRRMAVEEWSHGAAGRHALPVERGGRTGSFEQAQTSRFEQRCFFDCRSPDHTGVHGKIRMSQHIAESGDLPPWNFRFFVSPFLRQEFHRLAMISNTRMAASWVFKSRSKSSKFKSRTCACKRSHASMMSSRRRDGSRDMQQFGLDGAQKPWAASASRQEIHLRSKLVFQVDFQSHEIVESRGGCEIDQ